MIDNYLDKNSSADQNILLSPKKQLFSTRKSILAIFLIIFITIMVYCTFNFIKRHLPITTQESIHSFYLELEPMKINLMPSGVDMKTQYLQLELMLQFANDKYAMGLNNFKPMIVDTFQVFLRELRVSDINSSAGTLFLKEELLKRANKIVYPIIIDEVLIKNMVII